MCCRSVSSVGYNTRGAREPSVAIYSPSLSHGVCAHSTTSDTAPEYFRLVNTIYIYGRVYLAYMLSTGDTDPPHLRYLFLSRMRWVCRARGSTRVCSRIFIVHLSRERWLISMLRLAPVGALRYRPVGAGVLKISSSPRLLLLANSPRVSLFPRRVGGGGKADSRERANRHKARSFWHKSKPSVCEERESTWRDRSRFPPGASFTSIFLFARS